MYPAKIVEPLGITTQENGDENPTLAIHTIEQNVTRRPYCPNDRLAYPNNVVYWQSDYGPYKALGM